MTSRANGVRGGSITDVYSDREVREYQARKDKPLKDNGCDLHADCLTCPFEQCRYDLKVKATPEEAQLRRWRAAQLRKHLCYDCSELAIEGKRRCAVHLETHRQSQAALRNRRKANGQCVDCGDPTHYASRCAPCNETERGTAAEVYARAKERTS